MMNHYVWREITETNAWTGKTHTRHLRKFATADERSRVYTEVYQLNGRVYWTANIHIAFRPDLSRVAYGTYAATPRALSVAKARASYIAGVAIREALELREFARAA